MDSQNYDTTTLGIRLQQLRTSGEPVEHKIEQALNIGLEYLDVDTALVVRTYEEGDTWEAIVSTDKDNAQFSQGTTLDLSNTFCRRVVENDTPLTVHDATEQGLEDDPAVQIYNIASYFGTPLYEGDEISGTICFLGQEPREPFTPEEALFLELLGRFVENQVVESRYEADLDELSEVVSVLTRVLRHNIRNKLSVVKGYVNTQSQQSSQGLSPDIALDAVHEVLNLSEEARKLERILQESSDRRTVELTREIEQIVSTIEDQAPAASITVDIPESLDYFGRPTLPFALKEVIENAAEHAGEAPTVTVEVTDTDEVVTISIQDDGPGIPEEEQTVIAEGTETPLVHSMGLGHWIARTVVTKHDGDIETDVSDTGTTVTISLPRTTPELATSGSDDQLQTEYDKFRNVFDNAFEAIMIVDEDGRIIERNERAAEVLKMEPQELIGRRVQDFILTDSEQADVLDELLNEESELVELIDTQGDEHLMEYSARPDVVPGQHLLIGRDVTKERSQQRELKQTKEQMEFALDATETIVWEWNVETDQATFYPSETELYGTTVETREDFLNVVHPEDRQQVRDSLQQALESGETKHEEIRVIVNDEVRWIEAPGKPVVDADGTTRMIGVVRDITDRKDREQELERMSEFFREAEKLGTLGAWEFDANGTHVWTDGTRRIHEVDEGITPTIEEAIEFYHPEDRETVEQAVDTALENGVPFEQEVRLITVQNSQRWVRVRGRVLTNEEPRTVRGFIQDITDRKEREQELERADELLNHTERIADVGSWEIDTETMDVFWSENLFEILGVDADDEPSLDEAINVYHEDDQPIVEAAVENALDTGEKFNIEVRFKRPSGEVRWLRVQGTPTVEDGDVVTLRGAVQDITDHKEIESELRQERDLFEGIIKTSPIGITVVDADGTLSFVNEEGKEIYSRSNEEIDGLTHDDPRWGLIDENGDSLEAGLLPFERVISQEEPIYDQVIGIRQPSGDRVWVSVNGAPQWDDDGNLQQAIFAFEDITERRELETRLSEILGRVTDAFYALDDDFRFTHVNERAEELLQASEEEILGEMLWELYPEAADVDKVWDAFHTAMETQVPQSYEVYYEPLEFRVEATVHPSESGVSVYFRDVTEQREYEREIEQQNERLEEFARVVSHDIRNPLNVAQGQLTLAHDEFESERLDAAENALDRIERLIDDMLWLVREGQVIGSTAPVDLNGAIESAWMMVKTDSDRDEIVVPDQSELEPVEADYDRLCQLLENLFRNAIEHGGEDVTVRVGVLDDGFYIEDDGPGISEDVQEEVFDVGYSTSPDGTGFGLSIVKEITEAHGWKIAITEGTADGARFEITGVELGGE